MKKHVSPIFNFCILPFTVFLHSCVRLPERPLPLSEQAPQVLYAVPGPSEEISIRPKFAVVFSKPIDESTIGTRSILLVPGELDWDRYGKSSELYKAIDKGSLVPAILSFAVKEEGRIVLLSASEDLSPEATYTLLVTPRVLSPDKIPLTQEPGGPEIPFTAAYRTATADFVQEFDEIFDEEIPMETGDSSPDSAANPTSQEDPDPPEAEEPAGPETEPPPPMAPGKIALNEIFYDAVGSDTDGLLFVELFGTPGLNISGYKISFVDGGDGSIDDSITLPEGAQILSDGFYLIADSKTDSSAESNLSEADLIDNFDPQNGPDAVQLLDPDGGLVDAVGYGEGIIPLAENGIAAFETSAAPDVVNGHSLERKEPGLDTGNNLNDFMEREVPTPGQ